MTEQTKTRPSDYIFGSAARHASIQVNSFSSTLEHQRRLFAAASGQARCQPFWILSELRRPGHRQSWGRCWAWYDAEKSGAEGKSKEVTPRQALAWQVYGIVYNLFFHPLRDFPGPISQRASSLPWAWQNVCGRQAFHTQQLHEKYGSVVRITPNHLSFTEASAWRDIYGHLIGHKSGAQEMTKLKALVKSIDSLPTSILNADREEHGRVRRALAREILPHLPPPAPCRSSDDVL